MELDLEDLQPRVGLGGQVSWIRYIFGLEISGVLVKAEMLCFKNVYISFFDDRICSLCV